MVKPAVLATAGVDHGTVGAYLWRARFDYDWVERSTRKRLTSTDQ